MINFKKKMQYILFTWLLLQYSFISAAITVDNPIVDEYSSDIDNNVTYQVFPFTFDANTPVNAFTAQTPHFTQAAYNDAADRVRGITGLTFNPVPTFNGTYRNTVIFAEMDTGENFYTAIAVAFNNALQNCTNIVNNSLTIDVDGITITDIAFDVGINNGRGDINANCNDQIVDTGLIVFNTNEWNFIFNPGGTRGGGTLDTAPTPDLWVPPLAVQRHWILHEFTHLLGLGHNLQNNCNSVMMGNIVAPALGCTAFAPNVYWNHDDDLLTQIGY